MFAWCLVQMRLDFDGGEAFFPATFHFECNLLAALTLQAPAGGLWACLCAAFGAQVSFSLATSTGVSVTLSDPEAAQACGHHLRGS